MSAPALEQILTQAAEGLLFSSESDYPFTFFAWKKYCGKRLYARTVLRLLNLPPDTPIEKRKLENLFKRVTEIQDWFGEEEKATAKRFVALQQTLTQQLASVQVFRVGTIEIDVYIAGKTPEGYWAGLATKVIET